MRHILAILLICGAGSVTAPGEERLPAGVRPSPKVQLDLYEAALRACLAQVPLPAHRDLYVILNDGRLPGLAERFKDYHVIVRSGSPGSSPKHARWYWLHLGRVTTDRASVLVESAAATGMEALELGKRGGRWVVLSEHPFILTAPSGALP